MIARLCFAAAAGLACAQSPPPLEIRGTVVEGTLGIGGVTVTLYEFGHTPAESTTRTVFATAFTDSTGAFAFHPARVGEYYVEVKKEGYFAESFDGPTVDPIDNAGDTASLAPDHPSLELRFALMRLGELRGRVIDEDGKPLANLRVGLRPATSTQVVTDQDGYFTATKLRPGDYLVWMVPQHGSLEILPQFSASDLEILDQDLETSSWPSTPVPVRSGASLSVGTITARKTAYYRVHLSVAPADCTPDEKWTFSAIPVSDASGFAFPLPVPCAKEFLVRNLAPGSYSFALSSGRPGQTRRWAIAPVEVANKNLEIALTMAPGADISGRLIAAEGSRLPPLPGNIVIQVTPLVARQAGTQQLIKPDPDGKFLIRGLSGDLHQVSVKAPLNQWLYVKEMRYNGLAVTDGIITPVSGSPVPLEFVIDDKAATIRGSVTAAPDQAGVFVVVVKWPVSPEGAPLATLLSANAYTVTDAQGRFELVGLAPGEYRVAALPRDLLPRVITDGLIQLLNRGEKVTVERGSSQSIALKMIEP